MYSMLFKYILNVLEANLTERKEKGPTSQQPEVVVN